MKKAPKTVERIIEQGARYALRKSRTENTKNRLLEVIQKIDELQPRKSQDYGFIAYYTGGKLYRTTAGRFLNTKLLLSQHTHEKHTQAAAEKINKKLYGTSALVIKICKGAEITENYKNGVGSNSCMCGWSSKYTKLYADNTSIYSQIVMRLGNNAARAMIVQLDDGRTLQDRTYADSAQLFSEMEQYGIEKGYIVYAANGYRQKIDGKIKEMNFSELSAKVTIPDGLWDNGSLPYQDSLRRCQIDDDNNLILFRGERPIRNQEEHETTVTDGYYVRELTCYSCGIQLDDDEAYYQNEDNDRDAYCNECFRDRFFRCDDCENDCTTDDRNTARRHRHYVDICDRCMRRYYAQCERCGEYHHHDDLEDVENNNYCADCADEIREEIEEAQRQIEEENETN